MDGMSGEPVDAPTICEAFQRVLALVGDKVAIRTLDDSQTLTWTELGADVERVARGLAALGVAKGDTVAMLLPNGIPCHTVDLAAVHLGAVPFTIYNTSSADQVAYQVEHAGAKVLVTESAFADRCPDIEHLILADELDDLPENADLDFEATWKAVAAEDLVTMIYTSGTTGPPKAAQWAHRTIMSQLRSLNAVFPLPDENVISFLPMAHAGGRITSHYMPLVHGATITVCPDMREFAQYLGAVHPDSLFAVPRIWEKLQVAIEGLSHGNAEAEKAIAIGKERAKAMDADSAVPPEDAERLKAEHEQALQHLQPTLERLGLDRVKVAFTGGAPCAAEVVRFFRAVGFPLLEAYGSTECSLNIFNRIEAFKTGTAGVVLPDVEVKLADDGELLCRGPLNFVGYAGMDDALDADGWFATGDIAEIDDEGYVKIVDRKKEIIISSAGKNMSPANIEGAIKGESSLIGQIVCIGDGRKFNSALITLDLEAKPKYDSQDAIRAEIDRAVEAGNEQLMSPERVRKYTLVGDAWLPDSDELTPTAKVKRRNVNEKYAEQIDAMYQ
jgi:long-subunit acyl-CoA synthetase (AMP-forming)